MTTTTTLEMNGTFLSHGLSGKDRTPQNKEGEVTIEHAQTSIQTACERKVQLIKRRAKLSFLVALTLAYFVYFGYAMYCRFGDEGSVRLLVCTTFGVFYISGVYLFKVESFDRAFNGLVKRIKTSYSQGKRPTFVRWFLYLTFSGGCIVYVVINVGLKDPGKLRSLLGIVVLLLFMVLISNNKNKIKWHTVFWGLVLQFLLGVFVLKTDTGKGALNWTSSRLTEFTRYAKSGSIFMFGPKYVDHPFAMGTLPQIIVFCAAIQVLIYIGTIPFVVRTFGNLVAFLLDVSAPEAMNASANMLLAGAEASMIIRPYIEDMPIPHLFTVMTNSGASCAGAALIQFIQLGARPDYLLSASIMSVPAALACAKIIIPDDVNADSVSKQITHNDYTENKREADLGVPRKKSDAKHQEPKGLIEALVQGTKVGIALCVNLTGVQIVFNALVDMLDATVQWFGDRVLVHLTMKLILGYLFYPISYVIGVEIEDCRKGGELLGVKIVTNALIGYQNLGQVTKNRRLFDEYTQTYNDSYWHYDDGDIHLEKWNTTLTNGVITEKSEVVLTYALCGFASIASLGAALGILGALVPTRMNDISKLVIPSLFAGVIASLLTASVAGLIV